MLFWLDALKAARSRCLRNCRSDALTKPSFAGLKFDYHKPECPIDMARSEHVEAAVRAGLGSAESLKLAGDRLTNAETGRSYIAKLASKASVAQLIGEAEGLKRMWETSNGLVPKLHAFEKLDDGNKALFISDYINLGSMGGSAMTRLAEKMAKELHNPNKQLGDVKGFGFPVPTHCGVTEQDNTWEWVDSRWRCHTDAH